MAKIEFYKLKGEIPKGKMIKSITRFSDETKEELRIRQQVILRKQAKTRIKSKDILISSHVEDNETNLENNF